MTVPDDSLRKLRSDEAATASMHEVVPFTATLGIELLSQSPSEVRQPAVRFGGHDDEDRLVARVTQSQAVL